MRRGKGKYSFIKLYNFLMIGKKYKSNEDISLYMGVPTTRVHSLIHNARRNGLSIWTIYTGKQWVYVVKNITPAEAQQYTNRVAKFGLGVFRNNASTLAQSALIGGESVRTMIMDTGSRIIQTLEQPDRLQIEQQ